MSAGGAVTLPIQLSVVAEKQEITVKGEPGPSVSVEPDNNVTALVIKGDDLMALPDDPDDLSDALQALAVPAEAVPRAGSGKRKFHFHQTERFDPSPALLRGIYVLNGSPTPSDILLTSGADAVIGLSREIYRRPIGFSLGHKVALLTAALRIASKVPLFQLSVRPDLSQLDVTAARIEGHFGSKGANRRNHG